MATWGVPETVSRQVLTFTEIKPVEPGRWKFALEATFLAAVSLTVISLVLSPSLAIIGLTGAFLATIARSRPWRERLIILSTMYVGYLASVTLGALTGSRPWLLTIVLVLISLVVVLAYNALVNEQPGPMFLIMGAAIASYLPTVHVPVHTVIEINALGTGSACAVSLLIQIARRDTTVHDAVDDAQEAVHAYTETVPDQGDPAERGLLRDRAYAAVFRASTVLEAAVGSKPRSRRWSQDNLRLRQLHADLVRRISLAGLHAAPVAADEMEGQRYLGSPSFAYLLRWGLSQRSLPWLAARRLAAAVLLTCAVSYGLHLGHPYWAVLTTALIITVGADRLSLTHRALHRLAGTLAGVLVFFALHALHVRGLLLLGVALLLVFLMQIVVVRNYALGGIFITPMALLISTADNPYQPVGHIAGLRILDTAVGAASSLIVIWVSSRGTPVILVRRQYRRALRALERVLVMLADGEQSTPAGFEARRDLSFEQLQCAQVLQIAQVDLPLTLGSWGELEAALNKLSYTVLAACWTVDPPASLHADAMAARLQRILFKLPPVSRTLVDAHELAKDLHDVLRIGMARDRAASADTVSG
ncbi:FUSC family protein [Allobranchiibius sp. GilTou73]|uniref:FUSC family protein n=1 Tax=Allobranchiibius sp. GilTou73 TaxID=2904523 RepID=UPI001F2811B3|nr:FUSC family protein [Allobranchiibius sp. GilTou73]UIJ34682.1 FUSC family protein [Allobranchiibius sp. GilTou73]